MKKHGIIILGILFSTSPLFSEEIPFTILATSDLHSKFEPHTDPYRLGGVARIKTAMDRIENELSQKNNAVLRLDAGDCSEGSIYFNTDAGVSSYRMMNLLGYDAVTVGNHDWYLGPDFLNHVLTQPLHFSLLSANFNWRNVNEHPLRKKIKNYEVFYWVDGKFLRKGENGFEPDKDKEYFKIGIFGLSTNETFFSFSRTLSAACRN